MRVQANPTTRKENCFGTRKQRSLCLRLAQIMELAKELKKMQNGMTFRKKCLKLPKNHSKLGIARPGFNTLKIRMLPGWTIRSVRVSNGRKSHHLRKKWKKYSTGLRLWDHSSCWPNPKFSWNHRWKSRARINILKRNRKKTTWEQLNCNCNCI